MMSKKEKILEAAVEIASLQGLENLTAQAIADKLRVSQGGIFYHFSSQQKLIESLIPYVVETNHSIVSHHLASIRNVSNMTLLFEHIKANFLWAKKNPTHLSILMMFSSRTNGSQLQYILGEGEKRIYLYLAAAIAENEITLHNLSIRQLAQHIHNALTGALLLAPVKQLPLEKVFEDLKRSIQALVNLKTLIKKSEL